MKTSAVKAMRRNTPTRNAWLAMLGACVAVPHGTQMAALATYCARLRETQPPPPDKQHPKERRAVELVNRSRVRLVKRRIAPRLVALLWDSLADLDAAPLENFAAIVRRLREHRSDPQASLPLHDKVLRVADVARLEGKPLTGPEVLQRLRVSKEHDDASRERKALKLAGKLLAPAKRGPNKGTRKH